MEKNFTVKEFVDKYNSMATDNLKEKFVKENLKIEEYIPYLRKIEEANKIVTATTYSAKKVKDENGNEVIKPDNIHVNTALRYALTMHSLIELYTNIKTDIMNYMDEFDLLNRYDLISMITMEISEREFTEFNTIVEAAYNDVMVNEYELRAYVGKQMDRLFALVELFADELRPSLETLNKKIEKMDKKDLTKILKAFSFSENK